MTASFSGLNTSATEFGEVTSQTFERRIDLVIEPEPDHTDLSIFTFERGRRTGDFFHDVLERMDFQNLEELSPLIDLKLKTLRVPGNIARARHQSDPSAVDGSAAQSRHEFARYFKEGAALGG